jgi:cyclopropane fatty-acyl-phospholipid synthase-like methyltransferase
MIDDRMTALFFELFTGLPRQGPGDPVSTRRALAMVPGVGPSTRVLDIGCGTGAQTIELAQQSAARIVAIDWHPPFVETLRQQAAAAGVADRIDARVGDMHQLDAAPGSIDVLWCEGAISTIGVEAGLRAWRPLLASGGHMAITEVVWTTSEPPPACAEFWAREYPAIGTVESLLHAVDAAGYDLVGHFPLPQAAWWDDYYRPLQANIQAFRARHSDEPDAQALADQVQQEIDLWHAHAACYTYEFVVMRVR